MDTTNPMAACNGFLFIGWNAALPVQWPDIATNLLKHVEIGRRSVHTVCRLAFCS